MTDFSKTEDTKRLKKQIDKNINFEIDLSDHGFNQKIPISLNITINILSQNETHHPISTQTKEEAHSFLTLLG
jgi:hypothetical protein